MVKIQKVGIISDSNCDLPEKDIENLDIEIVPGRIIFGDSEVRRHYVDITYEEFYHRLVNDKETPSTSVPSPKEYLQAYENTLKKYEEAIILCTSSKLSNMFNTAQMVANQYYKDKITVIDSQSITIPMGITVSEAAKKAAEGISRKELIDYINNSLIGKCHGFGGIPTLTYLQKGGRIGKVASLMGNLLQVKPIISIEQGELMPLGKVRGMDNVYNLILDFVQKMLQEYKPNFIIVSHTVNTKTAQKLADDIRSLPNSPTDLRLIEMGPSVGAHLGPGGLMISWKGDFKKELLSL